MKAIGLLSSVDVHMSMAYHAIRVNHEERLGVEPETIMDEQDRSRKALVDAQ